MSLLDRPNYPDVPRKELLSHISCGARRVLDVGCCRGAFGLALKGQSPVEVWGIEPDPDSAHHAAERLDRVINDFFGPANPLPDAYFDLITFNDSLEHMPDPEAALRFCKDKLAPGGRIHCCVPNMRHIANLEHLLVGRDWHYEEQGIRDRTHLRFFTEKSVTTLFRDCGYHVREVVGINEDWWDRGKLWRRLFFRLFPEQTRDMRCIQMLVIAELLG